MSGRKYYEAYDDRYRQVHKEGLQWAASNPSPIVLEVLQKHFRNPRILEIGCGEGRDAAYLLNRGYRVMATDVSPAAISYCREKYPEHADAFQVLDCLNTGNTHTYDFIYAVAVLHMLVEEADRQGFFRFLKTHLAPGGMALVCSMGDGQFQMQSDPSNAFALAPRVHQESGRELMLAATTCRMVSFDALEQEIEASGLLLLEKGLCAVEGHFPSLMYAVVKTSG